MVPTLVERIKAPDGFSERNGLYVPEHYGLNRRDFLKGAGATGLLAIAGGGLEGCASLAQDASLYHNEELLASGRLKVPEGYNLAKIGNYYVITDPQGNSLVATKPTSYVERIVENFTDIGRGLGNFFRNIFDGAKYLYADENQKIREGRHIGIGNNFYRAFQNLASVFTLGFWVPEGEKKLEGAKEHLLHIPRKFYEAIIGNLVAGIPRSVGNMLNNLVSSGVYAIQLVPTIFTGYSHKANEAVDEVLNYLTTGIRTLSNSVPYIGAGWQRAAEISWDIPLPIVNYAARGRREGEDVEPTTFRKSLEILTSAGLTAAGIVIGKNAARGSKRKTPAAGAAGCAAPLVPLPGGGCGPPGGGG